MLPTERPFVLDALSEAAKASADLTQVVYSEDFQHGVRGCCGGS